MRTYRTKSYTVDVFPGGVVEIRTERRGVIGWAVFPRNGSARYAFRAAADRAREVIAGYRTR